MNYKIPTYSLLSNNVVTNKVVFLRADLNLPRVNGKVSDTYRLDMLMPTLKLLIDNNAKVILATHIGNPKEKNNDYSTKFLIDLLKERIDCDITHCNDCIGENVDKIINFKNYGDIILLENLRFYKEEKNGDVDFAEKLTHLAHIYINEAFSCSHRDHASISKIPYSVKHISGLNLEKEVNTLSKLFDKDSKKSKTFIVGGSKLSTKIDVIDNAINYAKNIVILGGMANLFILAKGNNIGKSFIEIEMLEKAKNILEKSKNSNVNILIPKEVVVTKEISENSEYSIKKVSEILDDEMIVDISEHEIENIINDINNSNIIVWNGPAGIIENKNFSKGTLYLAEKLSHLMQEGLKEIIIGGGDVASCLTVDQKKKFSFISTGGGAFLDLISSKKMPGIEKLISKSQNE